MGAWPTSIIHMDPKDQMKRVCEVMDHCIAPS